MCVLVLRFVSLLFLSVPNNIKFDATIFLHDLDFVRRHVYTCISIQKCENNWNTVSP